MDTTNASERASKDTTAGVIGEISPLLVDADSETSSTSSRSHHAAVLGQASVSDTILNLMKSCLGTGCLALPYACQQGGILMYLVGSFVIAAWNVYSVQRLVACLPYIPTRSEEDEARQTTTTSTTTTTTTTTAYRRLNRIRRQQQPPPEGTTTLGVVSWYAYGPLGLRVLDSLLLIFFIGILVAYVAALINFLDDTPLGWFGSLINASAAGVLMTGLSLVPDLGYLSRASAAGLVVLCLSFVVIAVCGATSTATSSSSSPLQYGDHGTSSSSLRWEPASWVGWSHWFGIVVLGYGVVPLTYNFHGSMAEPTELVPATAWALAGVAVCNAILGVGLYWEFPTLQGEILHEMGQGWVPVMTRLAMVGVVLLTTPLLIVPCSEMLEGKLGIAVAVGGRNTRRRDLLRCGIVATAVGFAVLVPSFVQVFAFVGCVCGGLLGLCMPPLLYLRLTQAALYGVDGVLLVAGVLATAASTLYSFGKLS